MSDICAIVPSYNHADYVVDAVASVLNQTAPVREVIVVDDASTDESLLRLRQFDDPRLRIIALDKNAGGSEALNIGIRASASPLIAICNSDDLWEPTKLERQIPWLKADPNIGAVFTGVSWIGEYGEELKDRGEAGEVFRVKNRSRHAWIKALVENGNCLCHPTVLIRRSVYDKVGLYDNRLRQLPDQKMWLALLMQTELHVLDEKLVRFRIHDNTSAPSPSVSTRDRNECCDIFLDLMSNMKSDDFFQAFGSHLPPTHPSYNLTVEKSLYLWAVGGHISQIAFWIANKLCMDLLSTESGKAAWESYGFTMLDFHVLRGIESPWLDVRGDSEFTAGERRVLARVGAEFRIKPVQPIYAKRPRMSHSQKIKREIRRIGGQIRRFLSRPVRLYRRIRAPRLPLPQR
jgi:glycosyltransferase involved in cell wall biosynthesis